VTAIRFGLPIGAGVLAGLLAATIPVGASNVRTASADGRSVLLALALAAVVVAIAVLLWVRDRATCRFLGRVQATFDPAVAKCAVTPGRESLPARAVGAVGQFRGLVIAAAMDAVLALALSCSAVAVLAVVDGPLAAAMAGLVTLTAVILGCLAAINRRSRSMVQARAARMSADLHQALRGIDEVHVYGRERAIADRWLVEFRRHQLGQRVGARLEAAASAVAAALPVLVFGMLALFVESIRLGPGRFLVANAAAAQLVLALGRIDHVYRLVFVVAADIVRPLRIPELPVGTPPGRLAGDIELVDVSYRYPGMSVVAVCTVSTRIRTGELVVISGPSGAGKSTVLNLLAGSIAPTSGAVRFDAADLAGLDLAAVRAQLGAVPQRLWAPRGTVRSVIAGAKGSADSAWAAAETVGLAPYLHSLPMGLSTVVTDGDGGFSRGQLQRMLLARALARDPRVLLLDDPTSALDPAAAAEIERVIAALPITRIVVTRSAALLRHADRVIVLAAGQVDTVIEGEMSCVGQFDSSDS